MNEILESQHQLVSMWKRFAADRPGADLADQPGVAVCWADSRFLFWNACILTESFTDADADPLRHRVGAVAAFLRRQRRAGLLIVAEDALEGRALAALPTAIAAEGLEPVIAMTGMVGAIVPVAGPPPPPALRLERVTTDAMLRDYADINSLGYGLDLADGRDGLEGSHLWKDEGYSYVGYVADQPVSTASAIVNDGLLYLGLVATDPAYQRRGYASATVRHALNEAHHATGLRRTLLHASDAGFPVYQRLGYHRTMRALTFKPIA